MPQGNYSRQVHGGANRHGFNNIQGGHRQQGDLVRGLLSTAITREGLANPQQSYIKRKRNEDLQIVKVVNNLLRNTVVVTYTVSKLNVSRVVDVYFKRYRRNTVDKFCEPCRETIDKRYNLALKEDCERFVLDVEEHMRVCPENLKTVNEALPLRVAGFDAIGQDTLYALEIHAFDVRRDATDALESTIEMSLASDRMTKDFSIKVRDIVNFNKIEELIGKWVVMNSKGAFKIKSKNELQHSYNVVMH